MVAGFTTGPVGFVLRVAFAVSGIAMMVPAHAFKGAIWTDIASFVIGCMLVASQVDIVRNLHPMLRNKV